MIAFNQNQIDSLTSSREAQFEKRCVAFLREHFPHLASMSDTAGELAAVQAGIQFAGFRSFTSEVDIIKYLYLRQLLGAGFDASGNCLSVLINDHTLSTTERLDGALDMVADSLEAQEARQT